MRLFIAIQPEEQMKKALTDIQERLRCLGVRGNYTRPENLHLTLAFIGEYPEADRVLEVMESTGFEAFSLRLRGMGSFGELWWAGLEESPELSKLVQQLRRVLAQAGIPFDRKKFLPHITLVRKPEYRQAPDFGAIALPRGETRVEKISLMVSSRGKNGMIYRALGEVYSGKQR